MLRAVPFAEAPREVKASAMRAARPASADQLSTGTGKALRARLKGGNPGTMSGDRTEAAVQRIEAALARIARAADNARGSPPAVSSSVTALVERHETLRENVAQTVAELDKLLGELEP